MGESKKETIQKVDGSQRQDSKTFTRIFFQSSKKKRIYVERGQKKKSCTIACACRTFNEVGKVVGGRKLEEDRSFGEREKRCLSARKSFAPFLLSCLR